MTLRIELERIFKRLQTRFKARRKTDEDPGDPDYPVLREDLQPITNIDELLKEYLSERVTAGVARLHASGSGIQEFARVPRGERWYVMAISILIQTGDMTLTTVFTSLDSAVASRVQIFSQTAATNLHTNLLDQIVVLDEDMTIDVNCTAVSANSTWDVRLLYAKEEAF